MALGRCALLRPDGHGHGPGRPLEALVELREPPRLLFGGPHTPAPHANIIRFRLGDHAGVSMSVQAKQPGNRTRPDLDQGAPGRRPRPPGGAGQRRRSGGRGRGLLRRRRGRTDVAYVTISTGVGGGVLLGGRLVSGRRSLGELGQAVLHCDGQPGTVEQLGSAGLVGAAAWSLATAAREVFSAR